jgi:ribosome-associated toxin RatA of RatAB toxin-antitoxin module
VASHAASDAPHFIRQGDLPPHKRSGFVSVHTFHRLAFGCRSAEIDRQRGSPLEIQRSALIARSAAHTFDLIEAAEHYPAFLPWCANAVILARDETIVSARLTINYHGLHIDLTTRNPKRRPYWMAIHLERGPFRRFEGEWRVLELAAEACKIEFTLRYEFDNALVGRLAGGVFDRIANTMVDAFAHRAQDARVREEGSADRPSSPTPGEIS